MTYTDIYCEVCGTKKTANGFYTNKNNEIKQKYRYNCDCQKINKKVNKNIIKTKKVNNEINNDLINYHPPCFTDEEIIRLKHIASNKLISADEVKSYYDGNKKDRIIKSINIDKALFASLLDEAKQKRSSLSDLINCIIGNYYS